MKPNSGTELLRQFAILSLVVISLISVALSLVMSFYLRKDLLDREWGITVDFTRTEALNHLTPADFAAPMAKQAQDRFKRLYNDMVKMPEIVRVKIFDAATTVVWSDEPRLIGQRFPDNAKLVSALAGRTMVSLKTERGRETVYEPSDLGPLAEVYVPIVFPGTTGVGGVVETYKVPEQVFANIRRGRLVVAGTTVAGGAFLYLSLFWIVRRAARRIERQRALTTHLHAVREEERSSMAHEVREELAQVLAALKMDLSWVAARLPEDRPALRTRTNEMLMVLAGAMESALRIASDSRPDVLDTLGVVAAIDWEARRFEARTGIRCLFTSAVPDVVLGRESRTAVFRIIQETLSNVARHAEATRVTIGLESRADRIILTVEDNGRGISDSEISDPKSLGILSMHESALLLGGTLRILGAPGKGTRVTVTVPLKRSGNATPGGGRAD